MRLQLADLFVLCTTFAIVCAFVRTQPAIAAFFPTVLYGSILASRASQRGVYRFEKTIIAGCIGACLAMLLLTLPIYLTSRTGDFDTVSEVLFMVAVLESLGIVIGMPIGIGVYFLHCFKPLKQKTGSMAGPCLRKDASTNTRYNADAIGEQCGPPKSAMRSLKITKSIGADIGDLGRSAIRVP